MNEGINEMYIAARTATLNPSRNVEQITNEIIFIKQNAQRVMLATYIELGKRLTEAKGMLNHGEWLPWLSEKVQFSRQSAERFMLAYREYGEIYDGANSNCSILSNLSISNALALLAVPENERESFAAEVDAAHISTRELEEAIKAREAAERERDMALRDAEDAQKRNVNITKQLNDTKQELAETAELLDEKITAYAALSSAAYELQENVNAAEKRIEELENRPVEVAVQEPLQEDVDKAVAEAMAETEKAHATEIEELKRNKQAEVQRADKLAEEKKKLAEQLAEVREKLKSADAGNAGEKAALTAEVERLKKQISMGGAEVQAFKMRFEDWQKAYNTMQIALDMLAPEQREKCEAAVKTVIAGWSA